jgi:hypothetical protein
MQVRLLSWVPTIGEDNMTDKTAKTTTEARRLEALAVKIRLLPPDKPLGEPKKKFSETFRAVDVIIDHFLNRGKNKHGDHE